MEPPEDGFTLLELLIVIVVLGVLSAIVVISLQGVQSSAAAAACQSDFATTTTAVGAYQAEMGSYPMGGRPTSGTDVDPATPPGFAAGSAPSGSNAARNDGELLVDGATSPNAGGTGHDGPWLKQAPTNPGSYTIWVANDGSGTVQVLDAAGHVPPNPTHTAQDCAAAAGPGGVTTTTAAGPTTPSTAPPTTSTTTTTVPPTTSTTTLPPTTTTTPPTTTTTIATRAPSFVSSGSTVFVHGFFGSFTVRASGSPQPSLSVSGTLPSGLTFDRSTGVLSGKARRSGVTHLTFTATNGVHPDATQRFTLTIV